MTMTTERKAQRHVDIEIYRYLYMAQLARGGSHIASTLTAATRKLAIGEVVREFCEQNPTGNVPIFLELLAESVKKRADSDAAAAVREYELPPRGHSSAGTR